MEHRWKWLEGRGRGFRGKGGGWNSGIHMTQQLSRARRADGLDFARFFLDL